MEVISTSPQHPRRYLLPALLPALLHPRGTPWLQGSQIEVSLAQSFLVHHLILHLTHPFHFIFRTCKAARAITYSPGQFLALKDTVNFFTIC